MRKIILQHTDHDIVSDETWFFNEDAFLLTPHIVLGSHHDAFSIYHFDEVITEEQALVKAKDSRMVTLHISGVYINEIKLEDVAEMTVVELAEALSKAPKEN